MVRGIWALIVLVVTTVALGTLAIPLSLFRGYHTIALGSLWSRILLRTAGIRPHYEGLEHASGSQVCVFISNHQSIVDIWALLPVLPRSVVFVAKESLFRIPILGWAMRASGFIPIDRRNTSRAIRSLELAGARIRQGRPVILFPEGTRSRDGRLGPFKKGAFHLALAAAVPVVPIAISGSGGLIRPRSIRVRPGSVRVTLCDPIDVTPFLPVDVDRLRETVRETIARRLDPVEVAPGDRVAHAESR